MQLKSLWVSISEKIYNTTRNPSLFSIQAFLISSRVWSYFYNKQKSPVRKWTGLFLFRDNTSKSSVSILGSVVKKLLK